VGIVTSAGDFAMKCGIEPGNKVAALSMTGCTAKYITLKCDEVIKIPETLDSAEAVVVIRTYTAAFQALMTTIHGKDRYSRKSLDGERILIVGPCGPFERAVVELALCLGAKSVNFWCISSHDNSHENSIRLLGARPLKEHADDWIDKLEGKIDIVIDSVCVDRYEYSFKALNKDGILVCTGMSTYESSKSDFVSCIEKTWVTSTCRLRSNFHFYDGIIKSFENERKGFMKDLIYVLSLLEKGKIKPKVGMRIPMKKVADVQDKLGKDPEVAEKRGVTIVEPWLMS
jgi:NADPH:quinone reductase-like Zn-dependent oxidoreductase